MRKQSTEDLGLGHGKDANFIACLALYQHRRDTAIGLAHVTTRQRGLLWYYNTLRQASYTELINKSFYLGVMRGARKRMREIKEQITPHISLGEAQELHQEYLKLQDTLNKAAEAINA